MSTILKVAFVDDCIFQQVMIKMLINRLKVFDFSFTCNNGRELIEKLDESAVHPDICIMDLHMPELSGIKTAYEIADRFPGIHVFGYTASNDMKEIEDFKSNGVIHVFSKSDPSFMLQEINQWICCKDRFNRGKKGVYV